MCTSSNLSPDMAKILNYNYDKIVSSSSIATMDTKNDISSIKQLLQNGAFPNYICHIRFPSFKDIVKGHL